MVYFTPSQRLRVLAGALCARWGSGGGSDCKRHPAALCGAAFRIQAAHSVSLQETLVEVGYLASQGVYCALLRPCSCVVGAESLCRCRRWVESRHKSSVLRTGKPALDDSEHSRQVTA